MYGQNDWGYDPSKHNLFMYGPADWNSELDIQKVIGWNPENNFMQNGYDFSCIQVRNRGHNTYHQMGKYGPLHPCGTQGNYCIEQTDDYPMTLPRLTAISDRWLVGVHHFTVPYVCREQMGLDPEDWTVEFLNPAGERITKRIDVVRLMATATDDCRQASTWGGAGNQCASQCPENVCNLPTGVIDAEHQSLAVKVNCQRDMCLIRLKDPILPGDGITPASIPDDTFIKKWFFDPSNDYERYPPHLQRTNRSMVAVDQHFRTGILHPVLNYYEGLQQTELCDGTVVPQGRYSERFDLGYSNYDYTPRSAGGSNQSGSSIDYRQLYTGDPDDAEQSEVHIGNDAHLSDYTLRDNMNSFYKGDSSSPIFYPLPNGELVFMGCLTFSNSFEILGASRGFVDALSVICGEHGDTLPKIVTENTDLSSKTQPSNIDGYRIYKSSISKDGPFYDITNQYNGADSYGLGSRTICENYSGVPCRRLGKDFVDLNVVPGETYHYYTTSVNVFDSSNSIYESNPSQVVSITVPSTKSGLVNQGNYRNIFDPDDGNSSSSDHIIYDDGIVPIENTYATYFDLIEGYRLGNNNLSIPFFGFVNPFESPLQPGVDHTNFPLYYRISGDDLNYDPIGIPMPTDPTSYQYIMGYSHETDSDITGIDYESNYKLALGSSNQNGLALINYLDSIETLWLTRNFPNPNNENLRSKLEPYYHSKIHFSNIKNLKKLVINPARYGNGRNDYGEDWSYSGSSSQGDSPETYLGYYSGVYLENDIDILGNLEVLIARDSNLDTSFQSMEYFNFYDLKSVKHLDLSNNKLYVVDYDIDSTHGIHNLEKLYLNNNKIGSNSTAWIEDSAYPDQNDSMPLFTQSFSNLNICDVSNNDIRTLNNTTDIDTEETFMENLNASSNPRLGIDGEFLMKSPNLKYLNLNSTNLQQGVRIKNASNLEFATIKGGQLRRLSVSSNTRPDTFSNLEHLILGSSNAEFTTLNLRYGNGNNPQGEYAAAGGEGNYYDYGFSTYNLRSLDVSDCPTLQSLHLPHSSDSYSDVAKKYLEVVNISNTKLGLQASLDSFMDNEAFSPTNYPSGHVLEVIAKNVKDVSNNPCYLSNGKYNELISAWASTGRTILLTIDVL